MRLFHVPSLRPRGDLPVSTPQSIAFTGDGSAIAVDERYGIGLWDVRTLRRRGPRIPPPDDTDTFTVIAPGAAAAAISRYGGGETSDLQVWNLTTGVRTASFPVRGNAVALSPDGRTVATQEAREDTSTARSSCGTSTSTR